LSRSVKWTLMFTALSITLLVAGCGKKSTKLEGTVTYLNAPLPRASIAFIDGKGQRVYGEVIDGKFSIPAVPTGDEIKVVVSTRAVREKYADLERRMAGPPPPKDAPKDAPSPPGPTVNPEHLEKIREIAELVKKLVPVPERYEKEETTPLVFKITSGMSDLAITLEK